MICLGFWLDSLWLGSFKLAGYVWLDRVGVLFDDLTGFLVDRFLRLLLMLSLTGSMLVGFGLFLLDYMFRQVMAF